jgi:hypothetical protein
MVAGLNYDVSASNIIYMLASLLGHEEEEAPKKRERSSDFCFCLHAK